LVKQIARTVLNPQLDAILVLPPMHRIVCFKFRKSATTATGSDAVGLKPTPAK
jgi:hypothetical protein